MDEFDSFELCVFDVNCVPRGRLVTKERLQEILERGGLGTNAAICYFGQNGFPLIHPWFGTRENPGNVCIRPDLYTLAKASKTSVGDHKVGQIICDLVAEDRPQEFPIAERIRLTELDPTSPRTVALRQLEKLRKQGIEIHYCFEMEFTLLRSSMDGPPFDPESSWGSMVDLPKTEEMMLDFMGVLKDARAHCATLHPEAGPSQFEFVLKLSQDIQGADMAARFRKEAKPFFWKRDLFVTFASFVQSVGVEFCRTMHLNHFLSTPEGNAFNNGKQGVSRVTWRWMAGIHRHLPALMALFCPSENCYSRYTDEFIQTLEFYTLHQRHSCFRRKREGGETYLENRLPSSFSNPYLVLAGTIAAGLDGIKNYPWGAEADYNGRLQMPPLPRNLQEALVELERDEYLTNELESSFVEVFIAMKRRGEIELPV